MKKVRERNKLCYCGSGKKIKQCCLTEKQKLIKQDLDKQKEYQDWNSWCERVSKLPFRAEIRSTNGSSSSMKVGRASITRNGVETILFDDDIELSVNSTNGDISEESYAIFSVPQNNKIPSEIKIGGNASVLNKNEYYIIEIINNPKKLKIKSVNGLFASIKISLQRDSNYNYFDIFFGLDGKEENINSEGIKNRPHIAFYPSGNGKFIRYSGYKCTLQGALDYCTKENNIFPSKITISIEEFSENLVLNFKFDSQLKKVILENAYFE